MAAAETSVRQDKSARSASSGSSASLARTLEDLEARLSRLSQAAAATREAFPEENQDVPETLSAVPEQSSQPASERLRGMIEARIGASRAAASSMAIEAAAAPDAPGDGARKRKRGQAAQKRLGTLAGEAETLQLQGQTLQLISGVAEDLQRLKGEIRDSLETRGRADLEEVRISFTELRALIEAQAGDRGQVGEIASILDRLAHLQSESADRASLKALRAEMDKVAALVADMARDDTLDAVNRRWDAFEERLATHIELDGAAKRDLGAELERLRATIGTLASEEQIRAVEARWDEFERRYFETAPGEEGERLAQLVKGEVETLRARIDALAEGLADHPDMDALSARFDAALARLGDRLEQVEEALVAMPALVGLDRTEERLRALAETVAALSERVDAPDLEHFVILEERLDEISEVLLNVVARPEATIDMGPVERIEARVAELSAKLERLTAEGATGDLSERVAALSQRIETFADQPRMDVLEEEMRKVSSRIDAALASLDRPAADTAAFEARLSALAEKLEAATASRVDDEAVRALETQIQRLAVQLSENTPSAVSQGDVDIDARLAAIEARLEEGRADVMSAARAAADEAVRRMQEEGARREGEHVVNLSEDLRSLEALCRQTDDRSIQVFEAVHATLLKIVERLTSIEKEMATAGPAEPVAAVPAPVSIPEPVAAAPAFAVATPAVDAFQGGEEAPEVNGPRGLRAAIARRFGSKPKEEAPSPADRLRADKREAEAQEDARAELSEVPALDAADSIFSREANRPLEPGSGAPDIASLLERVREQQQGGKGGDTGPKADFIAAARKAALAAATEADALRREAGVEEDQTGEAGKAKGRHRKPIMIAVGAVLLALMALPLGRSYLENRDPEAQTTLTTSVVPEAAEPIVEEAQAPSPVAETAPAPVEIAAAPQPQPEPVEEPAAEPAAPVQTQSAAATQAAPTSGEPVLEPVLPAMEETAAIPEPVEAASVAPVDARLGAALAALPAEARGALPEAPVGVGPTPLVAAADGGDDRAIFEIGLRLLEGRMGEPRPADALVWFAHAAADGFAPAQYSLGTLYEKGNGVERDPALARDWYTLAADQGNVRAMHNLAVLYATGIEGRSEPQTAADWFQMAAERGMRDSQYNLGILYARGAGVEQDFGQSYKWFRIVGQAGDADAVSKSEEVARTLSAEQVAALDAEIAAWAPAERVAQANSVDIPADWSGAPETTASIDRSRAIRNVQGILGNLGYDVGAADGIAGERTSNAIRAFQRDNGMQETGEIGEALMRELLKRNG